MSMFYGWMRLLTLSSICLVAAGGPAVAAQATASTDLAGDTTRVSLTELVEHLPEFLQAKSHLAFTGAIEKASTAERDAAIPKLVPWIEDRRPEVRKVALLTLYLVYLPSEARPGQGWTSVPAEYVPAIAAHLRDTDPGVRKSAAAALLPTEYSGMGRMS